MKARNFISSLAFMTMLVACTNENELLTPSNEDARERSSVRTLEEAKQIALNGIKMIQEDEAKVETRASDRPMRKLTDPIVKTRPLTRSEGENDTLMYVFNFADDQGYAIVDARLGCPGLIAVTEKGHYSEDTQSLSDEDPQKIINYLVNEYIHKEVNDSLPLRVPMEEYIEMDTVVLGSISPRITVKWDQDYPFNYFTSNGAAGCGIIAMMQVMSYYEYPFGEQELTYPGHDLDYIALNWTTFKQHTEYHYPNSLGCIAQPMHLNMGRLARQLGYMTESVYNDSTGLTSTLTSKIRMCMSFLGFTCTAWSNYATGTLYSMLQPGGIIIMRGDSNNGGHAWVVDGAKFLKIIFDHYISINYGPWINDEHVVSYELYNHINWGWIYGMGNGYFLDNIFNVKQAKWLDGIGVPNTSNINYTTNLKVMHVSL